MDLKRTYEIGDRVVTFPAIRGTVVAIEPRPGHKYGDTYLVRTDGGSVMPNTYMGMNLEAETLATVTPIREG